MDEELRETEKGAPAKLIVSGEDARMHLRRKAICLRTIREEVRKQQQDKLVAEQARSQHTAVTEQRNAVDRAEAARAAVARQRKLELQAEREKAADPYVQELKLF